MEAVKLLFFCLIFLVAVTAATATVTANTNLCYFAKEGCKAFNTVVYSLSGATTGQHSSSSFLCFNTACYGIKPVLAGVKKISEGLYITRISVKGDAYVQEYKTLNDRNECAVTQTTTYFGDHYRMVYNGEYVGDCNYFGRGDGFDVYCTWNDLYENVPAGTMITAEFDSRWFYGAIGACSYTLTKMPQQYGSFSFDDVAFNGAANFYGRRTGSTSVSVFSINVIQWGGYVTIYYTKQNKVNVSYCALEDGYYTWWSSITPINVEYVSNGQVIGSKSAVSGDAVLFSVPHKMVIKEAFDIEVDYNDKLQGCELISMPLGKAELKVKAKEGDIFIKQFRVIVNGTYEYVTDKYSVDLTQFLGQTVDLQIIPMFDDRLAENRTITITVGDNIITLDSYFYAVTMKAYYLNPLGQLKPTAFNYEINGEIVADKENSVGNIIYTGGAIDNYTLIIPAGIYNFTFKTNVLGFNKEDTKQVELLDNNYYRTLTFIASLTSTEISEYANESALLQVYVVDQNDNDVNNAVVRLYDSNNNLIAEQKTKDGYTVFSGLNIGSSYKVSVYVADLKKAEKTVTVNEQAQAIVIKITLSDSERRDLEEEDGGTETGGIEGGGGGEVAQNILAAVVGNYAFWGFMILCVLSVAAASSAGERIGLIVFVGGLGVLTFVIPLLPTAIFMIVAIVAGILFTWKVMDKIMGNRGD